MDKEEKKVEKKPEKKKLKSLYLRTHKNYNGVWYCKGLDISTLDKKIYDILKEHSQEEKR